MRQDAAAPTGADRADLVNTLALRLDAAWETRTAISPLSEANGIESPEDAYAIQSRWTALRIERREQVIGRKVGLTSRAMQRQMGVAEPDYGSLWGSRFYPAAHGRVAMPAEVFLQPRLEGEFAFLMGTPLAGPGVTPRQVLAATDAVAVAVEVIDSRIEDWRITLADTIADNSSYGALTVGPWSRTLRDADLKALRMLIRQDDVQLVEGLGAAALGDPAAAVAWLANRLGTFGVRLLPGDIVLSGSLARAIPVGRGDSLTVHMQGQPPLTVTFD